MKSEGRYSSYSLVVHILGIFAVWYTLQFSISLLSEQYKLDFQPLSPPFVWRWWCQCLSIYVAGVFHGWARREEKFCIEKICSDCNCTLLRWGHLKWRYMVGVVHKVVWYPESSGFSSGLSYVECRFSHSIPDSFLSWLIDSKVSLVMDKTVNALRFPDEPSRVYSYVSPCDSNWNQN